MDRDQAKTLLQFLDLERSSSFFLGPPSRPSLPLLHLLLAIMSSVIEDSRQLAQQMDLFEKELTSLLLATSASTTRASHRDHLSNQLKSADLVNRIAVGSYTLLSTFIPGTTQNQERELEMNILSDAQQDGLGEFYSRLAKLKEYHRKYPDISAASTTTAGVDFSALTEGNDEEWLDKKFTGEEGLGRYVDLHELHESWNNLAPVSTSGTTSSGGWKRLTYLQYLDSLTTFVLSPNIKSSPAYTTYLTRLLTYLSEFYERVFPLGDLDTILKGADKTFAERWEKGEVKGWSTTGEEATSTESEGIWCAACELGIAFQFIRVEERLNGYFTLTGQKLYSKQTVYSAHLTSKKHLKAAEKLSSSSTTDSPTTTTGPTSLASLTEQRQRKNRAIALKEALISAIVAPPTGPLSSILTDTLSNTERRAALTDRERATEIEELEAREAAEAAAAAESAMKKDPDAIVDDDEEEGRIFNPLKLPMGWDGKPIPFWLYKLHGLGVEYTCEICSDTTYMGRYVLVLLPFFHSVCQR